MYLWQIFLFTILGLLPIGIFCRWYVDMLFDLGHLGWVKYSGKKLSLLKGEVHSFGYSCQLRGFYLISLYLA